MSYRRLARPISIPAVLDLLLKQVSNKQKSRCLLIWHFLIVWCKPHQMFRVLAICSVAMAAIDFAFFDGQHFQAVEAVLRHFIY